jgi:vancomycin resistance protein YoaR
MKSRNHLVSRYVGSLFWVVPLTLGALCWLTYPFSDALAVKHLSMAGLSPQQKSNIELAAETLNGRVLQPGEVFSFNAVVGPREATRGYKSAPSYLGPESPSTVGGGICLLSSTVYQAALETGCDITERVPHLRTVHSVPPGLDAAVWYGKADLKFKNTLQCPIQLSTDWSNNKLCVRVLGREDNAESVELRRRVVRQTQGSVVVELYRLQDAAETLVSRDVYRTTQ